MKRVLGRGMDLEILDDILNRVLKDTCMTCYYGHADVV
jgi:hypothetical protein